MLSGLPPIPALLPTTEMPPLPLPGGAMQCQTLSRLRHAPETDAVQPGRCPLGGRAAAPGTGLHHPLLQLHEAVSPGHPRIRAPLDFAHNHPPLPGYGFAHRNRGGGARESAGANGASLLPGLVLELRCPPCGVAAWIQAPLFPRGHLLFPYRVASVPTNLNPGTSLFQPPPPGPLSRQSGICVCQLGSWHPTFLGGTPSSFHTRWHLCPPTWILAPHFPEGHLILSLCSPPAFARLWGAKWAPRKSLKKTERPTTPH